MNNPVSRLRILLVTVVFLMALSAAVEAASISDVTVTPTAGTSNSIFRITFIWRNTDESQVNTRDPYGPDPGTIQVLVRVPFVGVNAVNVPDNAYVGDPRNPEGRMYSIYVTGGLNLAQVPPGSGTQPWELDGTTIFYWSALRAMSDGSPNTVAQIIARALFTKKVEEGAEPQQVEVTGEVSGVPTIYDSHPCSNDRYGGVEWDRDYLEIRRTYGDDPNLDPLSTLAYAHPTSAGARVPDDFENPDDGTSSTIYTFKVKYYNDDNRPPIPYVDCKLRPGDVNTGVVVYLWNPETETYEPWAMQEEDPEDITYSDGKTYIFRREPEWYNDYCAWRVGEYKYFFGVCDDWIRFADGSIPYWADGEPDPRYPQPGQRRKRVYYPTAGTDIGNLGAGCVRHRHPWPYQAGNIYNVETYASRPTVQPGRGDLYPYPAYEHPVVCLALIGPGSFGSPTWCAGVVDPHYWMVNPQTGVETTGATASDKLHFQVIYQQIDGIAPEAASGGEISVHIFNGNDDSVPYGTYALKPTETPTPDKIKAGLLYRTPEPIQLPPGPHTFYFTACDGAPSPPAGRGTKRIRFPTRGRSGDNYIRGPYINHKPELLNPSVDPAIGTAGDNFRWSVTYRDADNQRPYSAHITIEYADGQWVTMQMTKKNQSDNNYAQGVEYVFDSRNLIHALQPGQRRFYFEFVDDWGAPTDVNVRVYGERVRLPNYPPELKEGWIYGPTINKNTKPRLTNGRVVAEDGTYNSATLWTYSVRYTDVDNQPPKFISVFIGQVVDGNIVWDSGHAMEPVDPTDTVYSDGKLYMYQTRLGGAASPDEDPVYYYYCFVASDGIDQASYDATNSPSAGAIWGALPQDDPAGENPMERIQLPSPGTLFTTSHYPLVANVPSRPGFNPLYTFPEVYTETGDRLDYDTLASDFENGLLKMFSPRQTILTRYWFGTPGPAPSTGIIYNQPPTLSDGRVSPNPGTSSDTYTYSVVYRDQDGAFGQAPSFVRVKVDDVPTILTPTYVGTPNYKSGVTYRTTMKLTPGVHRYYFEASDGAGFAVYDANGGRSSNQPILGVTPITGPYVNDKPTLTNGTVYPNPVTGISTSQTVTYNVTYTDANNEPPEEGYPVVYVNKSSVPSDTASTEAPHEGKVAAISGPVVTVTNIDGTDANWTANEFQGLPVQFRTGLLAGTAYRIVENSANTMTLLTDDAAADGLAVGDEFSIGKIVMQKVDVSDTNYTDGVVYEYRVPSLGEGAYKFHFKSVTTEVIGPNKTRETIVRFPTSGDLTGPTVNKTPPPGNVAPVLSDGMVIPVLGRSTDTFVFSVTYKDNDGDPPTSHEQVLGYVRVVIDGKTYAMAVTDTAPDYVMGVSCEASISGADLAGGPHSYYFEASDGWFITRYPATGSLTFTINRKPVLLNPKVSPVQGNAGREYEYSVTYVDLDGTPPSRLEVWIDGVMHSMDVTPPLGADFTRGVTYSYVLPPNSLSEGPPDMHKYQFTGSDGLEEANPTAEKTGPYVVANVAPLLYSGKVEPTEGWDDGTFTYQVTYRDPNGDSPKYVKVYIDGDDEAHAHTMTTTATDPDYTTGLTYSCTVDSLAAGSHTFFFEASDWMVVARDPDAGNYSGPTVRVRPRATITIECSESPRIGQTATISGQISPAMVVTLVISIKKPDGTIITKNVTTSSDGKYSTTWTPDYTGTWRLKASWAGGGDYRQSESPEITVVVGGPSITVSGLDMVSIPLRPANNFPDTSFGATPPYALAKWMPAISDYKFYSRLARYRTDFDFPGVAPGEAYWIKTDVPKEIAPNGSVITQTTTVRLRPGWNQVGCPFVTGIDWKNLMFRQNSGTPVSLEAAVSRGWVRDYGWTFDPDSRQYRLCHATRAGAERKMEAWRGYWIRALEECDLVFPGSDIEPPPIPFAEVEEAAAEAATTASAAKGWEVSIAAGLDDLVDEQNAFGVSTRETRIESPGYLEDFVDVSFLDKEGLRYAIDVKSGEASGKVWQLLVSTDRAAGNIELTWSGMESVPATVRLILVDEASGTSVDMKSVNSYTLPAAQAIGGKLFKIIATE